MDVAIFDDALEILGFAAAGEHGHLAGWAAVGGTETVTLSTGQLAPHPHPANCLNANGNQYQPQQGVWAVDAAQNPQYGSTKAGAMAPNIIGPSGNTQPHNNIQPYLTLNYCIALQGIYPSRP